MEEKKIWYFPYPGPDNTSVTLDIALERAKELGIKYIVVASRSGDTALSLERKAREVTYSGNLIMVTYHAGFYGGDSISFTPSRKEELEEKRVKIVMGSHSLSGVSRSFRQKFGGVSIPEIIAESYRRISQGFKVAVEVAIMAADGGAIPTTEDVVSMGGNSKGVDTAIVLRAAHQNSFFDLKIKEILCLPREEKD
ncbi:MAG TPA: pyruvate kinase alpha/beta domain-containing protein [Candidatus Atribacteria bacterium]|nr:pyruvate kinase alpha/beta domain-containing protein [Candidatus Atribacteria bacterium]